MKLRTKAEQNLPATMNQRIFYQLKPPHLTRAENCCGITGTCNG